MDAGLQLAADAVDPDAESVHRQADLAGERLAVAGVGLSLRGRALVIAEPQIPLVRLQPGEAPAETVEAAIGGLVVVERHRRPGAPLGEDALLPRGAPQRLLVEQVGDAAEVAVGIARPQLDPFG